MTKKSDLYQLRSREKRESRIKDTRNLILLKSYSGLLNNQKWYRIFDLLGSHNFGFKLKTLISPEIKKVDQIQELQNSSILIDNSGDFIEFLELEELILEGDEEIKAELEKLNVDFTEELNIITVQGYRK